MKRIEPSCCPADRILAAFVFGRETDLPFDEVATHVSECVDCADRLDDLLQTLPKLTSIPRGIRDRVRAMEVHADVGKPIGLRLEQRPVPEKLGRFDVQGHLGSGSFGDVYLAFDPELRIQVAIKVSKRKLFSTAADRERNLQEARHAARLDHKGLVAVRDVIIENDQVMIVMKLVAGETLKKRIAREKFTPAAAVRLMIEVARAAHHAHSAGLVHRDLKPANILLDSQENPVIADFGLVVDRGEWVPTGTGQERAGSPPYMSPEQLLQGPEATDHRSDIWAMGIMLAEMVHGQHPFQWKKRHELYDAIANQTLQLRHVAGLADLNLIIRRCLARDPADRFQSADDLAKRLNAWAQRRFPVGMARWKYGWRRNTLIAATFVTIALSVWINQRASRNARIEKTLGQIDAAPAHQISRLVQSLKELEIDESSLSRHPTLLHTSNQFRTNLIRAATGLASPDQQLEITNYLRTAGVDEIEAVIQTVRSTPAQSRLSAVIGAQLADTTIRADERLHLAAALAGLGPESVLWSRIGDSTALALCSLDDETLATWLPLFRAVAQTHFERPLLGLLKSTTVDQTIQNRCARAIAYYFLDNLDVITNAIQVANVSEVSLLSGAFKDKSIENARQKFGDALKEVSSQPRLVATSAAENATESDLQTARLALALWLLGDVEPIKQSLQTSADQTLQTLVIFGLAELPLDPAQAKRVIDGCLNSHDPLSATTKRGFLQALALLEPDLLKPYITDAWWRPIWSGDPDGGVHASAELLGKRVGLILDVRDLKPKRYGNWLVDNVGSWRQSFAIVNKQEVHLGNHLKAEKPLGATHWPWHLRKLPRTVAIAHHEVTIDQYRQFAQAERQGRMPRLVGSSQCAIMGLTLSDACAFCNWCSKSAGLEECYETAIDTEGAQIHIPKPDYLSKNGYRLPTDAEWEIACRAGTHTPRFFGQTTTTKQWTKATDSPYWSYGWLHGAPGRVVVNGEEITQLVGMRLPNRWGLFDVYGNARELCGASPEPDPEAGMVIDYEVADYGQALISKTVIPPLRGPCYFDDGGHFARSYSRTTEFLFDPTAGLRLARTLHD